MFLGFTNSNTNKIFFLFNALPNLSYIELKHDFFIFNTVKGRVKFIFVLKFFNSLLLFIACLSFFT